jgi:hypothetical protein
MLVWGIIGNIKRIKGVIPYGDFIEGCIKHSWAVPS